MKISRIRKSDEQRTAAASVVQGRRLQYAELERRERQKEGEVITAKFRSSPLFCLWITSPKFVPWASWTADKGNGHGWSPDGWLVGWLVGFGLSEMLRCACARFRLPSSSGGRTTTVQRRRNITITNTDLLFCDCHASDNRNYFPAEGRPHAHALNQGGGVGRRERHIR